MELLRIIAMAMIITLHFFRGNRFPETGTTNEMVYFLYESMAICGVNVFVILTGFFSLNENRIRFRKILDILIVIAFWEFIGFMLCVAAGTRDFLLKDLIRTMFPVFFGSRWFIKAYIIILLLLPFLNIVLKSISKRSYLLLLAVQLFLFSLWPSFLPNPPFDDYGYSFIHFVTVYCLAGYIRQHIKKYPPKWLCIIGYVVCFGIVLVSKILGIGYEWAYNSPFVIGEAVFLFLFFSQFRIQKEWINRLAACAFGVYLVHTNVFFNGIGYEKLFHGSLIVNGQPGILIVCVPVCTAFFYLFGFALESIRKLLFRYTVDPLINRLPLHDPIIICKDAEKT